MNNKTNVSENLTPQQQKEILSRIIHLRCDLLGYSQVKFACAINKSQAYISLREQGEKEISMQYVYQISKMLNVNINWLLYGDEHEVFLYPQPSSPEHEVLENLQRLYRLDNSDIDFLRVYFEMSTEQRTLLKDTFQLIHRLPSI